MHHTSLNYNHIFGVKSFKEKLLEGKQVGMLYHFTHPQSLIWILTQDRLEKGRHPFISFTRNFDLKTPYGKDRSKNWSSVRIAVDGTQLSNKYKIEPYSDVSQGFQKKFGNSEAEEAIRKPEIANISKYIKQIDVLKNVDWSVEHLDFGIDIDDPLSDYTDEDVTKPQEFLDVLKRLGWSNKIKINLVSSFRPVK